ncbi:TadE/TadG family type IV pilus assembly protein [Ramlibacter sp. 2FC]|uniref:TadE/TadG family type IV pilus assembly protein n=1 Tax=Ramlibacter sp. 2FC TaxID=2502188 RepID=UPI0010F6D287|nr:TadE/TadG family type IV pilus assembly protein [Ramlibacter sp. 2FC]
MRSPHLPARRMKKSWRGVAAVEFALVLLPFLVMLLGAIEFGRLLFLWNTVQEVTRNAARQAVVTDFSLSTETDKIKYSAVFRSNAGSLPAAPEVTNAHVVIRYLNAAGNVASPMPVSPGDNISACLDSERTSSCIRFVEVCLSTGSSCQSDQLVSFVPLVSLFDADLAGLKIPLSTVRMPAESLGFRP